MKTKLMAVFLLLLTSHCFAQDNVKVGKQSKLISAFKYYQRAKKETVAKIENDSLKKIATTIYEANIIEPIEFNKILYDDHQRWLKDTVINGKNKKPKLEQYQMLYGQFLDQIRNKFPNYVYWLIRIPVFVKAKIISITYENKVAKIGEKGKIPYRKFVATAKIEETLQGSAYLNNQTEIKFYYVYWEHVEPEHDFQIGETYLLPLWNRVIEDNPPLAIATVFDNNGARFLAKDGILHDNYNAFQMGNEINWSDFVKKFNDRVYRIKNILEY